jgi:hypothetical protein
MLAYIVIMITDKRKHGPPECMSLERGSILAAHGCLRGVPQRHEEPGKGVSQQRANKGFLTATQLLLFVWFGVSPCCLILAV